ncbi:signal peptide peptidase SppA [Bythopirellula goksoeyrii]|uniref:Protease 4 n=1 Tax=Bythopirellula goksoeyrii TaxID=1400387 RepID=A0A5B9Q5X7_9BACT|nr:signal peptide peptidase SppA [Bythopirellula goksoeyrii]QEG34474.1 Protease 4 [Bythopirellula goksoeyrii]
MRSRFLSTDAVLLAMLACLSFATSLQADTATAEPTEKTQEATASDKNVEPSAEKKDVKVRLAHIKIEGELPESAGQMSFFGDLGLDLRKTIARLDKAANDKKVDGIILEIGSAALSRGKLNELREAILNIRKSGKKVFAQLESADGSQYLLASACDEIIMPEAAVIVIPGVQLQIAYYKELLGKIGVEADMLHVGESKGAAEPLMRHNMSEPVRKNLTALVDDLYDQMLTTIAADRDLQIKEVKRIVNRGLLTANQAKSAGLIDRVEYYDEFRDELKQEYKADQLVYVINYGKQEIDTDFSGPMGMIKLFQSIMGGSSGGESSKGPKLALVYAVGAITSGKSESGFGTEVMGSETIVKALHEAAKDENVKAIVLRINSPGGSALASDIIWRATQAIDKPIIASMGDVAASGGYYIAMGADKIIAEPGTITGSIGVVGGKLSLAGLFDKIGVSTDSINRGENSNIFSSTTKFSEGERKVVTDMMQDIYRLFTTKAAEGRKMDLDKLEALAGGQVYTGRIAKRNGLIDEVGTLKDAFQTAKTMAGLDPDKKYELLILPEPTNPLEELFGTDLDKERETHALSSLGQLVPELAGSLNHATQLRGLMRERAMLLMPFWVEVK